MSFLDVKDCGAIGDGTTDDTSAIQTALNTAFQVYFPPGNYKITTALTLRSKHHLFGAGDSAKIFTTTNNINLITGTDVTDVLIDKLHFVGNNTASLFTNGNGVLFHAAAGGCRRVSVQNCRFENFGNATSDCGCAINFYNGCQDITIANNHISGGLGDVSVSDIILNETSGFAQIIGNRCCSANSQGIFVNVATNSIGKVIIANNICRDHTRHGIQNEYDGPAYSDVVIEGNLCYNNGSTGVYCPGGSDAGSTVISNNVIDACGGGPPEQDPAATGGILVGTGHPVVIANNHVLRAGRDTSGNPRSGDGWGIRCNNCGEVLIHGNVVELAADIGIVVSIQSKNCCIKDNVVEDCALEQIRMEVDTIVIQSAVIQGNKVRCVNVDAQGIVMYNLGAVGGKNLVITDNVIIGLKQDTSKAGLDFLFAVAQGVISNNVIHNWDFGVRFGAGASLFLDGRLLFGQNRITENDVGVKYEYNNDYEFGFMVGNQLSGNATTLDPGGGYAHLRNAISIYPVKVFYDSAAPVTGTWALGDTVYNTAPAATGPSGYIGWVCTVAGAPGTWNPFGDIV
jgi:hypothetical protein